MVFNFDVRAKGLNVSTHVSPRSRILRHYLRHLIHRPYWRWTWSKIDNGSGLAETRLQTDVTLLWGGEGSGEIPFRMYKWFYFPAKCHNF